MSVVKLRQTADEIADYIYKAMNVHDCSAIPTARQFADGWAAVVMVMADRFGIDMLCDSWDTPTKLANHFGVSFYQLKQALTTCKVPGKKVAGKNKTTYSRQAARDALEHCGYLSRR